jgi:hypothetical protein
LPDNSRRDRKNSARRGKIYAPKKTPNMAEKPQKTPKIPGSYDEDSIKSLDWVEHIRPRPGM